MEEAAVRRRTNGRSARVRRSVLNSTLRLLAEEGVDALSIAAVAAQAGVHETSIYRRWGTREKLMLDAILSLSETELPVPDRGSLVEDLTGLAEELCRYMSSPLGLAVARLLSTPSTDPELETTRAEIWHERIAAAAAAVQRAVDRGEARPDTDGRFVVEMLVAPIHWRVLVLQQPLEPELPAQLAAVVAQGIQLQSSGLNSERKEIP
ncbi:MULTISPECIES: TetR/AcrR family transcriptional regulator [unclassified Pseudonocardia]|uniref:TetR/AcrR family transcriptional regulator n=1 Tax=unclassified Pseudonocardia TaxID=2619320 RepID=UPI0009E8846F|nr:MULTISPECIES: TetR/AcrR family transcriptional regulator [unclassified Pseudonocardia]